MRAGWWWIDRWRKSTAYTDMTAEQQGCYRNLLDECWLRDGLLPLSEKALAQISGDYEAWGRCRDVVMARFRCTDDGYRNDTHDEVQDESRKRSEKQKRYRDRLKVGNAGGNSNGNRNGHVTPSPSPSPSPDQNSGSGTDAAPAKAVRRAIARPSDVTEETWASFLAQRKAKRAAVTDTAIAGIRSQAEKAGWTMEKALQECCVRGWTAFKADWVQRDSGKRAASEGFTEKDYGPIRPLRNA